MKVLVVIPTTGNVEQEALVSIYSQDFADYSVLVSAMKPINMDGDPEKNKVKNIVRNRNYARKMALGTDAEWFLWADNDVVFPKNAITEFLKHGKDMMGGWYQKVSKEFVAGKIVKDDIFTLFSEVQPGEVKVDMVGFGAVMMKRKVLEQISFKDGTDEFVKTETGGKYFAGECMMFCKDAATIGFPTYMIGDIVCKHIPPQVFVVPQVPIVPEKKAEEKKEEKAKK